LQLRLFLIRGFVAIAWAVAFATASDSLTTGAKVLLVLYPGWPRVALIRNSAWSRSTRPPAGWKFIIQAWLLTRRPHRVSLAT
jgi:hypothetical protein